MRDVPARVPDADRVPRAPPGRVREASPSGAVVSGTVRRRLAGPATSDDGPRDSGDGALRRRLRGAQFCFVSPVAADARRSPSSAVGRGLRVTPSLARTPQARQVGRPRPSPFPAPPPPGSPQRVLCMSLCLVCSRMWGPCLDFQNVKKAT